MSIERSPSLATMLMRNLYSSAPGELLLNLKLESKRNFARLIMVVGGPIVLAFVLEDLDELSMGRYMAVAPQLVSLSVLIAIFFYTRNPVGPKKEYIAYNVFLFTFISAIGVVLWYVITIEGQWNRTQWAYIFPLLASFAIGRKAGLLLSISFFVPVFLMTNSSDSIIHQGDQAPLTEQLMTRFYLAFLLITAGAYFIERSVRRDEQALTKSRDELENSHIKTSEAYEQLQVDTEERKLAEEALRRAHSELEKQVEERTESLAKAKVKAEIANSAKVG